ncbi:MAG TPA: 16S rRNA (guanine(527)-N(7))-methyltransferase RsmG [Drouetiella sp.]
METEINQALEVLSERAKKLSVDLTERQSDKLAKYLAHLAKYNEHTNLVSNAQPKVVALEHLLDSITLVDTVREQLAKRKGPGRLIDIGSGAGFPGLILAIFFEDAEITLMDSIEKKTNFLVEACDILELDNVEVLNDRAESMAHHPQYRETFDVATARAVGAAEIICELTVPMLTVGGLLLIQKTGAQAEDQMHQARKASKPLGGVIDSVINLDAEVLEKERCLILVRKEEPTPDRYPRAWKKIKDKPLGQ